MAGSIPTESELKIPAADLDTVRSRLRELGAALLTPPQRELNAVFDTASATLRGASQLLRLRSTGDRWTLTFKGAPRFEGHVKQRDELEVQLSDGATLVAILARLGFEPIVRYEKDRERWSLGSIEVALDHTPMGDFVELEGLPEGLEAAAVDLGLDPGESLRGSYLGLWAEYRERHPELALGPDMVFGG